MRNAIARRVRVYGRSFALVACFVLTACGYAFVRSDALPGGGALRVEAFKNATSMAEAGGWAQQAAREALAARGQLAPESSEGPVLEGELVSVRSGPSALGASGVQALRVEVEVALAIIEGRERIYWDRATGAEDYAAGMDVTESEGNRRAALRRLLLRVMNESLSRMQVGR